VTDQPRRWPPAAGLLGAASFLLIGWSGLLIPSLIRSVKDGFAQSDAGIGVFYFLYALVYAAGSLGGGLLTERVGRRTVLSLGAVLHGFGLIALGAAPSWPVFLLAALPAGLGVGVIDGGGNGLFLDLFKTERGRALNLLHLCFSLGALTAPLVVGRLVEGGAAWQSILMGTGVVAIVVGILFAVVAMPSGRHHGTAGADGDVAAVAPGGRRRLPTPLLLLALAIACYVASEVGVSNWLVRFLEPAPLTQATTALALFWAGLTLGRLTAARLADRYDHTRFTIVSAAATGVVLIGAILIPSLPVSVALFALAGFATGPVFPMIIVIGGDRYPERSSAVSGFLGGSAVVGSIIYPPIMGFLSVTVGLTIAMLGTVLLAFACAGSLVLVSRQPVTEPAPAIG
jgi:MFS transporter, FHS family, glucose/mannose:H+ symporter